MAQRPDAPTAPVTRLKTAGHVAIAATEFERGAALPLKEACRALFTASHRDDGVNDADRLWCGHGVAVVLPDDLLDNLRGVGIDPITGEDVPVLPPQRLRLLLSPAPMWPLDPFSAKRSVAAFVEDVPGDEPDESSDSEIDFCKTATRPTVVTCSPTDAFYASHKNDPSHLVLCAAGKSEPHCPVEACPFGVHIAKKVLRKGDRIVIARPADCLDHAGRRQKRSQVTQSTKNMLQKGDTKAAPTLCRGVVRHVAEGRFFYDVAPEDHEEHCDMVWTGSAIFRVVNAPSGEKAYRGRSQSYKHMRVELIGLRSRPRPQPPREVDALIRRYDLDADESSQGTRDSALLGAQHIDEGRERAKKLREKWKEPHNCRGRWTHEGTSIDSFLDQVRAEGDERERLRDLKRQEPPPVRRDDGGQRAIKRILRKQLKEFFLGEPWVPGPPPDLDKMDSAPRFVAENCALKGVDALMKLAIAYIGINRLDGAAECLTCVARACAKPGTEGIERGLEVLGNEACLIALRDALKGPPVSSDAWDGASSDDESTTSRTSSYYSGLPSPAGSQSSHYSTASRASHSTMGSSRPGSRQRRNRSRPGSALNTPRRPGSRSRSRPGSRQRSRPTTPATESRPTTATSDDSEADRERLRIQAEADAKAAQAEEEALAKQAMAEEKLRRERECQELLAASAGEIVAAIARRTNYDGLQTLRMMPDAVCASLRGLVETDDAEDGLGRVAAWAHGVLRCADALARGDFLALDLRNGKAPNFLRRLNPSLSALDRNGGDSYDCSQRVDHYCSVSDKPWKLLPKVDTIDPHDGYMVRAAPKYEVAKLILADLKRSKQPCSLTSWGGVGDDLLGRRTVVTRSFDETNRPPPEPLPEDETQKVFDEEMAKRITPEGVAEVEAERADTADRAGLQYHPRVFVPDGERGPPVTTDERMRRPVTGTRDYARRALPAPLVPSLKLRKRVFDRKITGRLGEES